MGYALRKTSPVSHVRVHVRKRALPRKPDLQNGERALRVVFLPGDFLVERRVEKRSGGKKSCGQLRLAHRGYRIL